MKRIISLLVVLTLLFSGCGKSDNGLIVPEPTAQLVLTALQDKDYELFSANVAYEKEQNPIFGKNIKNGSGNEALDAWFEGLSFEIISEDDNETVAEITNRDLRDFEKGYAEAVLSGDILLEAYILSIDKYVASTVTVKVVEVDGANKIWVDTELKNALLGGIGNRA